MTWTPQAIKRLRFKRKESQTEFGDTIGVTRLTVYNWEAGNTEPLPLAVRRLDEVNRAKKKVA